ncbi:MAG: hypothetical protein KF718_27420 [Polyangiaceae bacterium]|nr:hypothetical protein [Polyangiaceae bacterium]
MNALNLLRRTKLASWALVAVALCACGGSGDDPAGGTAGGAGTGATGTGSGGGSSGTTCATACDHQVATQTACGVTVTPATHEQRLSRDVDLAASLVQSGQIDDAMAIAREVEAQLPALQDAPEQARFGVAWVLYVVGDLDRARGVLATLGTPSAHSPGGALPSRVLLLRGALALDGGDIELVHASCEQLDAIAHSNFERTYTRIQRLLVELASGRYEAVLGGVDEMLAAARDLERVDLEVAIETARVRALAELGEPPDPSNADEQPTSRLEDMFALAVLHHRLLWDADAPAPTLALPGHPEIAATAHLTEATRFLAAGKAALAAEPAQAGAALARQFGYRVVEADATSLLREARFVAGQLDDWRSLVHRPPAVELPSHADLSRVELAVTGDDGFDLGALDLLAHTATERARRRAAALLGEEARLDLRDAAFVEAARAIAGCHVHHRASNPAGGQASGPVLDLDPRRRLVWVSRRRIAFARRPLLWIILDLLATSPAPVDKERLLREAWSVDV